MIHLQACGTRSSSTFLSNVSTAVVGLGLLCEVPRSHSDTSQSVGLLWTSDRPVTGTSTWQHTRDRHPWPQWNSNPQSQQVSGRRPMPYTARPLRSARAPLTLEFMRVHALLLISPTKKDIAYSLRCQNTRICQFVFHFCSNHWNDVLHL
jgi:hypothetical protein